MEELHIPRKEKRDKMLTIPVTIAEHQIIKEYCIKQNVTLTSLVRFALKSTYNFSTL